MKKQIILLIYFFRRCFHKLNPIGHNKINRCVRIERDVYLRNCIVGRNTYLGMHSYFNNVRIGSYCSIAGSVVVGAMEHSHWAYSTSSFLSDEGYDDKYTIIGHDVWIGTNCIIRQGVTIGEGAVIGANSFVNKDVPPYAIVFGSPAKLYKYRFPDDVIKRLNACEYWKYNPQRAKELLKSI